MAHAQFEFDLTGGSRSQVPRSKVRVDLFVGLKPTAAAGRQSTDIANDLLDRMRIREDVRPPHVTLFGLGPHSIFSRMDLAAKKEELSSVNVEAFAVTFDRAVGLKQEDNKTAVALCCSEQNPHLDQLRKDIIEAQRQPGIEDGPAPAFTPASDVVLHPTTVPATIIRGASSHLARTRLSHNTELSRRMQA